MYKIFICTILIVGFLFIFITKVHALTLSEEGDTNNDGVVNILDFNLIVSCFGKKALTLSCPNKIGADINKDGNVDGVDYTIVLKYFGQVDTSNLDQDSQNIDSTLNQMDSDLNSIDQSLNETPVPFP
jgi:hypothetical protein